MEELKMAQEQPREAAATAATEVSTILNRFVVDGNFDRQLTIALSSGDANKAADLLEEMNIRGATVKLSSMKPRTAAIVANVHLQAEICIQVTITVCF
jgi:hypothetical protein